MFAFRIGSDGATIRVNDSDANEESSESVAKMSDDTAADSRRQTEALLDEIHMETKQQALTSELKDLSSLESQYKNNYSDGATNHFLAGLQALQQRYQSIRTVRGDGNCYYRAFLYSLLEQLLQRKIPSAEGQRLLDFVKTLSWHDILSQGYDETALDIFHDEIVELVERVVGVIATTGSSAVTTAAATVEAGSHNTEGTAPTGTSITSGVFHDEMNQENGVSDYCTWYLRVVTATHLKRDPARFEPYLWDAQAQSGGDSDIPLDMAQFCAQYIEPMGQECEHLQVLALAEAMGVCVQVEYLDGRASAQPPPASVEVSSPSTVQSHCFGPEAAPTRLHLLYRPGHYDILYPKPLVE